MHGRWSNYRKGEEKERTGGGLSTNVTKARKRVLGEFKNQKLEHNRGTLKDNAFIKHGRSLKQAVSSAKEESSSSLEDWDKESRGASIVFNPNQDCLNRMGVCAFVVVTEDTDKMAFGARLSHLGGSPVQIKSLGGNHILVVFQSRSEMLSYVKVVKTAGDGNLILFREWEDGDCASSRSCWLNIYRVPPPAWCEEFFSLIAVRFGRFLQLFNRLDNSDDLEVAKVQISTTYRFPISRFFKTLIGKKMYDITVCESHSSTFPGGGP
ncbi:hypothetical protein Tsubulata_034854 [Turnera subulata]|uniref:DUF4283 domain-containing protein n=1 Tax=Turnera subulata TaxID=218843 RepID=A0A9Q0GDL8_9ROSI|nr:hypothetical protein Tsubulata_034854 [Turnera subulata]